MQYPPPYMSITTLAEHLDLSVRTVEEWVRCGKLPKSLDTRGKRLWRWRDIDEAMQKMRAAEADEQREQRMREAVTKLMDRS